jgi:catechol 2,3-dioxygenase-like lactoylglutathione lyase family enzyme/ketosteroid isomerase-like protein
MARDRATRVRDAFAALARGDLDPLDELLAADAQWTGAAAPGPGDCLSRREIRDMLGAAQGRLGDLDEVFEVDAERVAVVTTAGGAERVHVLTFAGERVTAVQAARDRGAIDDLPPVAPRSAAVDGVRADAAHRPEGLIPFVHVADIERSIAFYETLGFEVADTHSHEGRRDWAAMRAGRAELMLAQGHPVDAAAQGVLFYLYSPDLAALRETLVRAGVAVTAIGDGSPGPREEMRVVDPDGYCLMIAQTGS